MRIIQCAALLLPLFQCANIPKASSSEQKVKILVHDSKTTTAYLNPLDLMSKKDLPGILPYGFVINTNRVTSEDIIVNKQRISIPKNGKALLLTLSNHKGEEFYQDLQLTALPLQLSKFKELNLKEFHVPIYLHYAEVAFRVGHGSSSESQSQVITKYLKREFNRTALITIRELFKKEGKQRWPKVKMGYIEATDAKHGFVHVIEPLTQSANKNLDSKYFSLPYNQNDPNSTYIKVQHKVINLTKKVKDIKKTENPHIVIEMEIVRKNADKSILFSHAPHYIVRDPTGEEIENLPKIGEKMYNIYFKFNSLVPSANSDSFLVEKDEEKTKKRSPKPRNRRQKDTSS